MSKNTVAFSLFGADELRNTLCDALNFEAGKIMTHQFPDEEVMITIDTDLRSKSVIFILSTDRPNAKTLPLILAVETARELGANKIGLIAPYLAYMRQDIQFHSGEGISSKYFARLLSSYFDWLITIDPHLHRWHSLNEVFTIDTKVLHATDNIAHWVRSNVQNPLLIGPDMESTQWVAEIAKISQAPYLIVEKTRFGDANVSATVPQIEQYPNHTPVLIDDIISTGRTMIETIKHIQTYGIHNIICLAVHAVFANNAYDELMKTGITDIVTCNTIVHPSNKIDISNLFIEALIEK
ncbi:MULTISPECIES: ribose-phosphate pyrophosphokinase [Legionella]|uniref:ribose-phosphate pyrophosphokinase n=1 Tax=Legionella TaxID=445 RepID=UPI0009599B7A|nr:MULTISPECIES: ribose-phosphate pyrophosphokinase [Legionella]MBN9227361.1 ribose-phosphate pyrophosphokinase [Legionella steelei]OJW16536.1 MAG: phosphoribosylpyrophosphate synthetase [Legionella sp. 39-23]